jgi:ParB family transcriptional regulator, chromosome partitioning protein
MTTTKPKSAPRPKGLGMGLAQLLGGNDLSLSIKPSTGLATVTNTLAISALQAGRYQPRQRMDESGLQDLAASIKQHGLMQPIVVRKLPVAIGPVTHEIIAGERRFRASKMIGLASVPVIYREVDDQNALALALIENIQREDLNPFEEAQAIKRLIEEFSYSHEQAAEAIGRSRSATSNLLRLLNLAEHVQDLLLAGDLDMGHARALLAVEKVQQVMLANLVVEKRLSVRETEKLVNQQLAADQKREGPLSKSGGKQGNVPLDADIAKLSERLSDALGAEVTVKPKSKQAGELLIKFSSHEQLKGLLERFGVGDTLGH